MAVTSLDLNTFYDYALELTTTVGLKVTPISGGAIWLIIRHGDETYEN